MDPSASSSSLSSLPLRSQNQGFTDAAPLMPLPPQDKQSQLHSKFEQDVGDWIEDIEGKMEWVDRLPQLSKARSLLNPSGEVRHEDEDEDEGYEEEVAPEPNSSSVAGRKLMQQYGGLQQRQQLTESALALAAAAAIAADLRPSTRRRSTSVEAAKGSDSEREDARSDSERRGIENWRKRRISMIWREMEKNNRSGSSSSEDDSPEPLRTPMSVEAQPPPGRGVSAELPSLRKSPPRDDSPCEAKARRLAASGQQRQRQNSLESPESVNLPPEPRETSPSPLELESQHDGQDDCEGNTQASSEPAFAGKMDFDYMDFIVEKGRIASAWSEPDDHVYEADRESCDDPKGRPRGRKRRKLNSARPKPPATTATAAAAVNADPAPGLDSEEHFPSSPPVTCPARRWSFPSTILSADAARSPRSHEREEEEEEKEDASAPSSSSPHPKPKWRRGRLVSVSSSSCLEMAPARSFLRSAAALRVRFRSRSPPPAPPPSERSCTGQEEASGREEEQQPGAENGVNGSTSG